MSTILFRDDFSGTTLDLTKWSPNWYGSNKTAITKPVNGNETACYSPAQVSVKNNKLHLRLEDTPTKANDGKTYPQVTGCVTTLNSFSFIDGYLETRALIPGDATGLFNWAAIWTDGLGTWPKTGESDILETLSGRASWHYHSPSGGPGGSVVLTGGWHTFAEDVRNGLTRYYYDGKLVGQETSIKSPHFIIMANQSGKYGGKNVYPTDMKIDYITVTS